MATSVTFNGSSFTVPAVGDRRWGQNVTNLLIALAGNALAKSGGNFTLTADVNFGANFGVSAKYFKSITSNIAQTGIIRLANNEGIGFRNFANDADLILKANASNQLEFGGSLIASNADVTTLAGRVTTAETNIATNTTNINTNTTDIALKLNKANDTATGLTIGDQVDVTKVSSPAAPAAGKLRIYAKSDDKLYQQTSAGVESVLGGGGLTPTDATTLPTTLANSVAYQLSQTTSTTALLPVTALAATIEITDAKGTCSATNFIGITAGAGDTILYKGVPVTDRFVIRRRNATVRFNKAAGSSVWEVTYQMAAIAVNATVDNVQLFSKVVTGTTNASQGAGVSIGHGINSAKIVGVQVFVNNSAGAGIAPAYTYAAGYEFHVEYSGTSVVVLNKAANSANILSKPITILITYTA